jgi:NADPH:quinone reductase-like Zn-dependent oxidoreductase
VIDSVYPLAEVEKAHAHVAANKNFGKVVLQVIE